MEKKDSQVAPGTLEVVRTFLNTWRIPNDTREPTDELASHEAMQRFYSTWFGDTGEGSGVSIVPELVRKLRVDLRSILGTSDVLLLSTWLARQPVEVILSADAAGLPILTYRPARVQGCRLCAAVLALVVEAISRSTWIRLKACPDCQWVFYDHTKNKSKVWCLMTASGSQGRSCGSISISAEILFARIAEIKVVAPSLGDTLVESVFNPPEVPCAQGSHRAPDS